LEKSVHCRLLVPQRLYGIEPGGASGWIQARHQAYKESKNDAEYHQPQRHRPEMFGWQGLTLEPDVGSEVDDLADGPAQRDSDKTAEGQAENRRVVVRILQNKGVSGT